jgi:hypothetical protein
MEIGALNNRIEKIVIAGGGISGWLSALFLDRFLNASGKICSITLVDTEETGTPDAEATMLDFLKFLQLLGINEYDFIINSNATFKIGIKFVNWSGEGNNDVFWHPFIARGPIIGDFPMIDWWLKKKTFFKGFSLTADYYSSVNPHLGDANRSPKVLSETRNFIGEVPYAYHLDTGSTIKYLSRIAKLRGIKSIIDEIVQVKLDADGSVSQLLTKKNGPFSGDLYIDCTGFRGLLINKNMKEPFTPYDDTIFVDNLVMVKSPRPPADNTIPPYTTATALSSGWYWHIPLFSANSYGYLYSSPFITGEKAEKELLEKIGKKAGEAEVKHLKLRPGHTRNPWKKNCLAIGLSAGYIDPLESTALQITELALWGLLLNFPDKTFNPALVKNYNNFIAGKQSNIHDFISLHYLLSRKIDTKFWKDLKSKMKISEVLKEDLEMLDKVFFDFRTKKSTIASMFNRESYFYILAGMKHLPKTYLNLLNYSSLEKVADDAYLNLIENSPLLKTLPDHYRSLNNIYTTYKQTLFEPERV